MCAFHKHINEMMIQAEDSTRRLLVARSTSLPSTWSYHPLCTEYQCTKSRVGETNALFPSISSPWNPSSPNEREESVSMTKRRKGEEEKERKKALVERNLVSRRSGGETAERRAEEWGEGGREARGEESA